MPHDHPCTSLTRTEVRILVELVTGTTRKALARLVGLSSRQLYRKIGEIRQKLGAKNDFQLGIQAYRAGAVRVADCGLLDPVPLAPDHWRPGPGDPP